MSSRANDFSPDAYLSRALREEVARREAWRLEDLADFIGQGCELNRAQVKPSAWIDLANGNRELVDFRGARHVSKTIHLRPVLRPVAIRARFYWPIGGQDHELDAANSSRY